MTNKIERKYYLPLDMPDDITNEDIAGCYDTDASPLEDIQQFLEFMEGHADNLVLMVMEGDDHVLHDGAIEDDLWDEFCAIYHNVRNGRPVNEATRESLKSVYRKFTSSVLFGGL